MAKRFTDTRKWELPWYRKLPPVEKCFWNYVLDRCDHAGIWDVDFELASVYIGVKLDVKSIRSSFSDRFFEINNGKQWVIRNFIQFQYGQLSEGVKAHVSVLNILHSKGLEYPFPKGYDKGMDRDRVRVKDKDKDKDKDPKAYERLCRDAARRERKRKHGQE